MPANAKNLIDWASVRREYEAGKSCRQISRELKDRGTPVSHVAISKRANKEGWVLTDAPVTKPEWKPDVNKLAVSQEPTTRSQRAVAAFGKRCPETAQEILLLIRDHGVSPSNAGATCGISPSTISEWRKSDPAFEEQIGLARRAYLGTREENIHLAGDRGDLRANLAILERAPESREDWQPRTAQGNSGPNIQVVLNVSDPQRIEPPTITVGSK